MKKTTMPAVFLLFILISVFAPGAAAQDAEAIVHASRNRIKSETVSSRAKMTLRAKNGTTSERLIDQYSKDGPNGARTVIVFQQPASVAGVRFLTMANTGKLDDRWIFLPTLGRVRRIVASEGSGSFMGTDFSYDDISSTSRGAELDNHTLLREEAFGGIACYVIQSIPKDSSYQYSKMIQWIEKDSKIIKKIELYDKKNALVKTVEMSGLKEVQGRMVMTVTKITTHASGTSTTLSNEILKYDDPIPESVFTLEYLKTGRPR
jgi:outer membrane lipoprotein-sorting protein